MAHLVYGIDVGSHSIKVAVLEAGFRHQRLVDAFEEPVPAGDAALGERQAEALRAVHIRIHPEATLHAGVPGELLSLRVLALPFTDARKIEQVVSYELEGQIVHPLEDVVFDHVIVRTGPEGSTVVAAALRKDDVSTQIASLQAAGVEPRSLYAAPVAYRALPVMPAPEAGDPPACRAIVDLGATRTNVCILRDGDVAFARTLMRGGAQLTAAVAGAWRCSLAEAEGGKQREGFIAGPGRRPPTAVAERMDRVLREALAPLVRDLRQTLASFRAQTKVAVDGLWITGGGGRLDGIADFLSAELELPAAPLPVGPAEEVGASLSSSYALCVAYARAGARGKKEIDFRRGPFVYRASMSLLRGKGLHVAALLVALVVAASVDAMAALSRLKKERATLDEELRAASQELFGEQKEAKTVTSLLSKGFQQDLVPMPKATAFDLLDQISRKMPSADSIKLDITELDIKAKRTFIKGTVDSAAAVDEMAARLKEIDCFDEIKKGPITEVAGAKQFTLDIVSRCP